MFRAESLSSLDLGIALSLVVQWLGYMTLTHEIRVQFPSRGPCFESHSTTLFQASWLSFEAFTSLMRIGFLYDNCLGFDLASDYTDIILSTVAAELNKRVAFTWSLCSTCTEEEC